ncbi:MAG: hypothetical protein WB392_03545, partial [Methanotrichaceae archaeon]
LNLNALVEPSFNTTMYSDSNSSSYLADIILNNKTMATIDIINYNQWQDTGFPDAYTKVLLYDALNRSGEIKNPVTTMMTVDGNKAMMTSLVNPESGDNVIIANYWKDSTKIADYGLTAGKTEVEILSRLPKDEASSLLSTLKITSTGQPSTAPTNPPVTSSGSSHPIIDSQCMKEWTDLGYTSNIIGFMGWCLSPS